MEGPPKKKMRGSPVKGSPLKGSPKKDAKGKGSPKKTVTVTTPPQHASEAPLTPPAPTLGSPAKHGSPLAPTLSPPGSPRVVGEDDVKGALEDAYGMPMPAELAAVWSIALRCRAKSPVEAFASLGVRLVGPFEVLSGHLASDIDVHMQWRYKHDPPETMTVLTDATTNRPVKHWCYHRDDPAKLPTMVVKGNKGHTFTIEGASLLGVLLGLSKETKDTKLTSLLSDALGKKKEPGSRAVRDARYKQSLGRPFSGLGISVPYDKKTEVGYRGLGMEGARLRELAEAMQVAEAPKKQDTADYGELCTFCDIANDEGDFGHALEVGLDFFALATGDTVIHREALRLLDVAYMLLGRQLFRSTITKLMAFRSDPSNPPVCKGMKKQTLPLAHPSISQTLSFMGGPSNL